MIEVNDESKDDLLQICLLLEMLSCMCALSIFYNRKNNGLKLFLLVTGMTICVTVMVILTYLTLTVQLNKRSDRVIFITCTVKSVVEFIALIKTRSYKNDRKIEDYL